MLQTLNAPFAVSFKGISFNTSTFKLLTLFVLTAGLSGLFAIIINSFVGLLLFPISCLASPLIVFYIYTQIDDILNDKILTFLHIPEEQQLAEEADANAAK